MGCGASVQQHADFGVDEDAIAPADTKPAADVDTGKKKGKGGKSLRDDGAAVEADLVVRAVSRNRMESRYPWEMDGRQLPEDVTIIFILGAPGAGKSTQCQRLAKVYGATHLSSGDLLRMEVDSGTALGKWVNDLMQQGSLVPFQVTLTLLKKAMLASSSPVILIDGFPREKEQLALFERTICPAHAIIFLDVPLEVAMERARGRGRSDDTEASIQQQWQIFNEQTAAVRKHFAHEERAKVLDGSRPLDEVFEQLSQVYQQLEAMREEELNELQAKAQAAHKGGKHGKAGTTGAAAQEDDEEEENSSY